MSYTYETSEPPPEPLPAPDFEHRLDYFTEHVSALTSQFLDACHVQAMKLTTEVASELAEQLSGPRDALEFAKLRSLGMAVEDIEQNCEQLHAQACFSRNSCDGLLPCRRVGELLIPAAVPGFYPDDSWQTSGHTKDYFSAASGSVFEYLPAREALSNFSRELAPFLADRLVASSYLPVSEIFGGISSSSRLLRVRVFAQATDARVSYSPSYFIKYAPLSAPSLPVVSHVLPGRYVFMLTTHDKKKLEDHEVFDIPPCFDVHLNV